MDGEAMAELAAFVRERMARAAADKRLYEADGARLNAQLLQGEINMGTAILAWLDARTSPVQDDEPDEDEGDTAD